MPMSTIDIPTPAGPCSTQIFTPDGAGPWPAVIFCFDAGGPRDAMSAMASRIAGTGYLVALPDLYHRVGSIRTLMPPGTSSETSIMTIFTDPRTRALFLEGHFVAATDEDNLRTDVGPLLDHLAARPDVRGGVGTTGYCMGGNVSFRLATIFGDRIAATAAFHAGGLVTKAPTSPHLHADRIRSRVYIGGATADPSFTDEMKATLIQALAAAHVDATVETYEGRHGFAVTDNPTYDEPSAERHHAALAALFATTLAKA